MNKENKKDMKPTFDEVIRMDQELQYLASYEVTRGKIYVPKSIEEIIELNAKIAAKFNYFKGLIRSGECSFEFIKNSVLAKNGPYPQSNQAVDYSEPEIVSASTESKDDAEMNNQAKDFIGKLIGSLFPNATIEKITCETDEPKKENKIVKQPKKKSKKRKN